MSGTKKTTNAIDARVGSQLRKLRMAAGLSQGHVGEALGVTFQQIQKYERGANRVSASRLQHLAQILKVSVASFFSEEPGVSVSPPATSDRVVDLQDFLSTDEGARLARAFLGINDPHVRRKLFGLVDALAMNSAD